MNRCNCSYFYFYGSLLLGKLNIKLRILAKNMGCYILHQKYIKEVKYSRHIDCFTVHNRCQKIICDTSIGQHVKELIVLIKYVLYLLVLRVSKSRTNLTVQELLTKLLLQQELHFCQQPYLNQLFYCGKYSCNAASLNLLTSGIDLVMIKYFQIYFIIINLTKTYQACVFNYAIDFLKYDLGYALCRFYLKFSMQ